MSTSRRGRINSIRSDEGGFQPSTLTWRQRLNRLLRLPTGRASTIASSDTRRRSSSRSTRADSEERRGRGVSGLQAVPRGQAERQGAGPLNSHPIIRLASPTRQHAPEPRNQSQPQPHRGEQVRIESSSSSDSNGATVHSDDYDYPLPRGSNRPSRAIMRREVHEVHSDDEDGRGYIPSVSSVLADDLVSVRTVSSCTSPPIRYETASSHETSYQPRRGVPGTQGRMTGTRSSLRREAARVGWEKRYVPSNVCAYKYYL